MNKKLLILLLSVGILYADGDNKDLLKTTSEQSDASIAMAKSGFFIGGRIATITTKDDIDGKRLIEDTTTTPNAGNFSCSKMPDGSTSCHGSGKITFGGTSVSQDLYNIKETSEESSFTYGGRIGYNYFFTPRNGLRFIAAFDVLNLKFASGNLGLLQDSETNRYYSASAGVDYLFDFTKGKSPFGLFLGMGYEYNFGKVFSDLKQNAKSSLDIKNSGPYVNFGISQTIARAVRIDLGYKMLLYKYFDGYYQTYETSQIAANTQREIYNVGREKISTGLLYMALDILF